MKTNSVFAVFMNAPEIAVAEQQLLAAGFSAAQISVVAQTLSESPDLPYKQSTHITSGAQVGAGIGFFVGAVLGLLFGLETISLPLFSAALALNGWSGMAFGGILGGLLGAGSGALVGIGTPPTASERMGGYAEHGAVMMRVHSDNPKQLRLAGEIMDRCGGTDVSEVDEETALTSVAMHTGFARI